MREMKLMIVLVFFALCLPGYSVVTPLYVYDNLNIGPGIQYVPDEIVVKFKDDVDQTTINLINSKLGTSVLSTNKWAGFKQIRIPHGASVEKMVERYSRSPFVEYAEPNYIASIAMIPNDPLYSYQWHMDNNVYGGIHAQAAWDVSSGGSNTVIVTILDTGVAYENYGSYYLAPDLAQTTFVQGYDYVSNDSHPNDQNSHGTHVCGTVAQSTNNSLGVAGVAYNTAIMPVRVLDANGYGTYTGIANGIYYATDNGADVISMSLGGSSSSSTLENACAYAYNHGVTLVAAAGNGGPSASPSYPAAYNAYVIAVSATRYDEAITWYSNIGSYVDVAAPGGDTSVDQNGDGYGDGVLQQTFNPNTKNPADFGYYYFQGTSMATPHVSGVAALLIASGVTGPDAVREAIQNTAEDHGPVGRDNYYGWGIVDAYAALNYSHPEVHDVAVTNVTAPAWALMGDPVNVTVSVANYGTFTETFTVTLTDLTDNVVIGAQSVTLSPAGTGSLAYTWNTTGASIGNHTIQASAEVVAGETNTSNNTASAVVEIRQPVHDIAVTAINAPSSVYKGDNASVTVTVQNPGTYSETPTVTLTDVTDNVLIGSKVITIAAGGIQNVAYTWNTTNASIGNHTLKAEALPVAGETNLTNNSMTAVVLVQQKPSEVITILSAKYSTGRKQLTVEAKSSLGNTVSLTLSSPITSYVYGKMTYSSSSKSFKYDKRNVPDPKGYVKVTSTGGGTATAAVTYN